jgi:hypothetical protein
VGCLSPSNLIKLIEFDFTFKKYEGVFEQNEFLDMEFVMYKLSSSFCIYVL